MTLLADLLVPRPALAYPLPPSAEERVKAWLEHVGIIIPDPAPVAMRWTANGLEDIPIELATEDDLVIHPDKADLYDLANVVAGIVRDERRRWPRWWSYRRWPITGRVASFLYVSGITASGGSWSSGGGDPIATRLYGLPSWRHLLGHRPYILWRQDWWWECHRRQGRTMRGRHRPARPFALGICARCAPCPSCGAPYDCREGCTL